jgi:hypothetical protein
MMRHVVQRLSTINNGVNSGKPEVGRRRDSGRERRFWKLGGRGDFQRSVSRNHFNAAIRHQGR